MADGVVGVKQSADPDRLVDNEVVVNDVGQTVYRQRTVTRKTNGRATGVLTAANANPAATQNNTAGASRTVVVLAVPDGHSSSAVELSPFSPGTQVVFEQSDTGVDGTWAATNMRRNNTPDVNESFSQIDNNPIGTNNVQLWKGTVGGIKFFRVRCAVLAAGDTITAVLETSEGVGGTFLLGNPPSFSDYFTNSSLTAPGQTVDVRTTGMGGWAIYAIGQFTGQVLFEATIDDVNWRPINGAVQGVGSLSQSATGTNVANQELTIRGSAGGLRRIRLRAASNFAGSLTVTCRAGAGTAGVFLTAPAPIAGLSAGAATTRRTVGTTAVQLDPTPLAVRSTVEVQYIATGAANNGKVHVAFGNGVSSSNGRELAPGESWTLDITAAVPLWAIASAAGQQVQLTELG